MFHSKSRATTESSVVNMQVEKKPPPAKDIESATTTTDPRAQPEDPNIVEYDGPNDPENPKNWSHAYKWTLLMILSGMSLTTNLTVLVCAPATPEILANFHSENQLDSTLIVSIWNLGATIGCLIMGPLSELYGRLPVYNIANLCFLMLLVAETQTTTSLNPSIVGDLFITEQRGRAQSILSLMPLIGPVLGPIAGGYIAQAKGWQWTFWFAFFVLAAFGISFLAIYRETYDATILRRKAQRIRKETGDPSMLSRYDHTISAPAVMRKALVRPIKIFCIPIFVVLALSGCVLSGYVYLIATSITEVFETTYDFSEGAAGLTFLGIAIGMATGALFCSITLDWYTKKMKGLHGGEIKPEWRLPPMALGFVISPIGLFLYGWTAQAHRQFVIPIIGTGLCGFAAYTVTIPVTTYLADTFGIYRASAMSAMTMTRNAMSTVLPLAAPALYRRLGLGWGNSVLAFIALAMAPIPFLLLRYGERVRRASNIEQWS